MKDARACELCGSVDGGDLDDWVIFDRPVGDGRLFMLARHVTGPKAVEWARGAKGRAVHACYGCVLETVWRGRRKVGGVK